MNQMACPKTGFSRRGFMIGIAGLTFAVAVGHERFGHAATEAPDVSGTAFNPWVSIAPSGEISIMAPASEMGNGSLTALPLILAEELDADWSKVLIVPAPPIDKIYGNPGLWGVMLTAHSIPSPATSRLCAPSVRKCVLCCSTMPRNTGAYLAPS